MNPNPNPSMGGGGGGGGDGGGVNGGNNGGGGDHGGNNGGRQGGGNNANPNPPLGGGGGGGGGGGDGGGNGGEGDGEGEGGNDNAGGVPGGGGPAVGPGVADIYRDWQKKCAKMGTIVVTPLRMVAVPLWRMLPKKWESEFATAFWREGHPSEVYIMHAVGVATRGSSIEAAFDRQRLVGHFGEPGYDHPENVKGKYRVFKTWFYSLLPVSHLYESKQLLSERRQGIINGTGRISKDTGLVILHEFEPVPTYIQAIDEIKASTVGSADPITDHAAKYQLVQGLQKPYKNYVQALPNYEHLTYQQTCKTLEDYSYRCDFHPSKEEVEDYLRTSGMQFGAAAHMSLGAAAHTHTHQSQQLSVNSVTMGGQAITQGAIPSYGALFMSPRPTLLAVNDNVNAISQQLGALAVTQQETRDDLKQGLDTINNTLKNAPAHLASSVEKGMTKATAQLVNVVEQMAKNNNNSYNNNNNSNNNSHKRKKPAPTHALEDGNQACNRCGSPHHTARQCREDLLCDTCGRKGHSTKMCWGQCRHCGKYGHQAHLCITLPDNAHLKEELSKRYRRNDGGRETASGSA